ncbi:hypothetical protein CUZ56_00914 [Saezia sanguinis]|uniref:Type II secretion system protein H n=2 Tax=Saezia sanguinis TaxID=1965230 RepID=A0A433SE12_9BURK|nr:hypothetical protein CUZ56_00914 [Saezia sanguinis]
MKVGMKDRYAAKGFTLIELLVVLMLLVILMTWAVPGFNDFKRNYQLESALVRLDSSIGWARSQAIRMQSFVVVQPVGGSWAQGWRVFADKNRNGSYDAGTDEVLQTEEKFADTLTVTGGNSVQINPSGMITEITAVARLSNGARTRNVSVRMNRLFICDPVTSGLPSNASIPSCS